MGYTIGNEAVYGLERAVKASGKLNLPELTAPKHAQKAVSVT